MRERTGSPRGEPSAPGDRAGGMFRHFGDCLRLVRESKRLRLTRLAALAGVSKSQLSRYETGHALPTLETTERLFTALGCTPDGFFLLLGHVNELWGREAPPPLSSLRNGILEEGFAGATAQIVDGLLELCRQVTAQEVKSGLPRVQARSAGQAHRD